MKAFLAQLVSYIQTLPQCKLGCHFGSLQVGLNPRGTQIKH